VIASGRTRLKRDLGRVDVGSQSNRRGEAEKRELIAAYDQRKDFFFGDSPPTRIREKGWGNLLVASAALSENRLRARRPRLYSNSGGQEGKEPHQKSQKSRKKKGGLAAPPGNQPECEIQTQSHRHEGMTPLKATDVETGRNRISVGDGVNLRVLTGRLGREVGGGGGSKLENYLGLGR